MMMLGSEGMLSMMIDDPLAVASSSSSSSSSSVLAGLGGFRRSVRLDDDGSRKFSEIGFFLIPFLESYRRFSVLRKKERGGGPVVLVGTRKEQSLKTCESKQVDQLIVQMAE